MCSLAATVLAHTVRANHTLDKKIDKVLKVLRKNLLTQLLVVRAKCMRCYRNLLQQSFLINTENSNNITFISLS